MTILNLNLKVGPKLRVGPRLSLADQLSRDPKFKTRELALCLSTPNNNILRAKDVIGKDTKALEEMAAELDKNMLDKSMPKMIPLSPGKEIMKDVATIGLFRQVMNGYEISGVDSMELFESLHVFCGSERAPLNKVNLDDARELAKRLSKLTDRKFRVPTEVEIDTVRSQLSGDLYCWVETNEESNLRDYPIVSNKYGARNAHAGRRYSFIGVRLVEDIA